MEYLVVPCFFRIFAAIKEQIITMATITEDYVSFETAKLLKEKGFDEICYLGYNKNGEYFPTSNRCNSQIIQPDLCMYYV